MKKSTKIITTLMAIGASATVIAPITSCSCANECLITFEATEGGILSGSTSLKVKSGTTWGEIENKPEPIPSIELGYSFDGWMIGSQPIVEETKIEKDVVIKATFKQTTKQYDVSIQKDEGIIFIETKQKNVGSDIIINYTCSDIHDLANVAVTIGEGKPFTPTIDKTNKKITIEHNLITDARKTIHVVVTTNIVRYLLNLSKDDGIKSLETYNVYGEDIVISYELEENYLLDEVKVQEEGQSPIEPSISKQNKTITIPADKIKDPTKTISIVITSKVETNISFTVKQSEIFNYVNYEGVNDDLVATYHFIPSGSPLKAGDVITAEIVSQQHNPTPDEEVQDKEIDFYNNVNEYVVQVDGEESIPFKFISTYTGTDSHLFEVQFTLKLTITRGEEYTSDTTIENIFYENGIATTRDMFTINGTTLQAINGDKWQDTNCNILVIPKDVTEIAGTAFQEAGVSKIPNIKWLILDETWGNVTDSDGCKLSKIGLNAFQNVKTCRGQLYIPSSVIEISSGAFNLDSGYDNCDLVFGENSQLKKIGASAFKNTHLGSKDGKLVLPHGLEILSSQAFQNCDFTSVVIPNTLTRVDGDETVTYGTFKNCQHLSEIDMTSYDEIPSYDIWKGKDKTFIDLPETGTVFIKDENLADEWKSFFAYLGLENADNWQFIEKSK